ERATEQPRPCPYVTHSHQRRTRGHELERSRFSSPLSGPRGSPPGRLPRLVRRSCGACPFLALPVAGTSSDGPAAAICKQSRTGRQGAEASQEPEAVRGQPGAAAEAGERDHQERAAAADDGRAAHRSPAEGPAVSVTHHLKPPFK